MLEHAVLGFIQGLTEFLPVSSSGHLVLAQHLFGITEARIETEIILHLGTVLSVVVFLRNDILALRKDIRSLWLILTVTVITGAIGILGNEFFEKVFNSVRFVALGWLFTGALLISTRFFGAGSRKGPALLDAVVLGLTQAVAIIPGVSRSGMTISTLLFRKLHPEAAFRFSFLVSIPVILGAALLKAKDIGFVLKGDPVVLSCGFIVSSVTGIAALWILKRVLLRSALHWFGYYCIVISAATLLFVR
jgi:undecaprenyl-diphosphatase